MHVCIYFLYIFRGYASTSRIKKYSDDEILKREIDALKEDNEEAMDLKKMEDYQTEMLRAKSTLLNTIYFEDFQMDDQDLDVPLESSLESLHQQKLWLLLLPTGISICISKYRYFYVL